MGRKKNKPFYEDVTITGIGAEGKSLARIGDKVVFTTYAVPGDVVDLQVTKKRKKYEEAQVVRYKSYSEDRAEAFCEHFGICGGCSWQNLPYSGQLRFKQKQVEDQLTRIGKLELPCLLPILGSTETVGYRNKLEFSFSNNRWKTLEEMNLSVSTETNGLGFHIPGMFDKVFHVSKCWLQPEPSNEIRNFIFRYASEHKLPFFDIRNQDGFLRTLTVRTSTSGEVMVIISFFREEKTVRELLLRSLSERFPGITSLLYAINPKGNDTLTDLEIFVFQGKPYITEEMEGLTFRIGPKSFYQTNSRQAYQLYTRVREFAALTGNETVYDLYTGTGTIALFLARFCRKVIGIEYVREAVEDARLNSEMNYITNAEFHAGDIRQIFNPRFLAEKGSPDVLVTDPPRSGMHEDVVKSIIEAHPARIVYVSCNPATQARDISLLSSNYRVEKVQPVDMFPHTHHVENIVLLLKK